MQFQLLGMVQGDAFSFMQARKIAPVFQLQPDTVYLINEFDNAAVFPNETSGRFNHSLTTPAAVYIINGDPVSVASGPTTTATTPHPPSPFGAYTGPVSQIPPPRPSLML